MDRKRAVSQLEEGGWDIVIIGGGIIGASIALSGAAAGYRTLLIEKGDWGAGASAGCFKVLHGGLRYLQQLDLPRVIESIQEQRRFRVMFPHLISPLPIVVPHYSTPPWKRAVFRAGFTLYDCIAALRNSGVEEELHLPRHAALTTEEVLKKAPGLPTEGLIGGLLFYDAQMNDSERLTLEVVKRASEFGATVLNYCQYQGRAEDGELGDRHVLQDTITGQRHLITTKAIVNTAGPRVRSLLSGGSVESSIRPTSKGLQLTLPWLGERAMVTLATQHSDDVSIIGSGGRSYFIQPWNGLSLVGTADILHEGESSELGFPGEEIERLLSEIRSLYRHPDLRPESVLYAFGGLRPLHPTALKRYARGELSSWGTIESLRHDEIQFVNEPRAETACLVIDVQGVKYTTAFSVASQVQDRLRVHLGVGASPKPCDPLWACRPTLTLDELFDALEGRLTRPLLERLRQRYGPAALELGEFILAEKEWAEPVCAEQENSTVVGEIAYFINHEQAHSLEDVLYRRMQGMGFGFPATELVDAVGVWMERLSPAGGYDRVAQRELLLKNSRRFGYCAP